MLKLPLSLTVAKGRLAPKLELGVAKKTHDETADRFAKLIESKSDGQRRSVCEAKNLPEDGKLPLGGMMQIERRVAGQAAARAKIDGLEEGARRPNRSEFDEEAEAVFIAPLASQMPIPPEAKSHESDVAVQPPAVDAPPPAPVKLSDPPLVSQRAKREPVDQLPATGRQGVKLVSLQTFPPPVSNAPSQVSVAAAPVSGTPAPAIPTIVATIDMPSVRVLNIKLHPEHLGELTISLKLRGNELAVNIEAHSGKAIEALRQDESILRKVLQSAGYDPSSLTIVVTPKDALTPMPVTPADTSGAAAQSTLTGGRGAGGDASPSGQGERRASFAAYDDGRRDSDDRAKMELPADRRGDGIFL